MFSKKAPKGNITNNLPPSSSEGVNHVTNDTKDLPSPSGKKEKQVGGRSEIEKVQTKMPEALDVFKDRETFISDNEQQLCVNFLNSLLGENSLSHDSQIWKEEVWKQTILSAAHAYNIIAPLLNQYEVCGQFKKQSGLSRQIKATKMELESIKVALF